MESWLSRWKAECRCQDSSVDRFPIGTTHWARTGKSQADAGSPDGRGLRHGAWPTSVSTCYSRMIPTREKCCDTSPSLPARPRVSKQTPQNESLSTLHHAPCTPETPPAVRVLPDAYPETSRPDTQ